MSLSKYMKSYSKSLIVLLASCIALNVMAAADKQTVQKGVTDAANGIPNAIKAKPPS